MAYFLKITHNFEDAYNEFPPEGPIPESAVDEFGNPHAPACFATHEEAEEALRRYRVTHNTGGLDIEIVGRPDRTPEQWWTWHDADSASWSTDVDTAEARCAAWVIGESDDGPKSADIQIAVELLSAVEHEGEYAYRAEETGEWYLISTSEMQDLADMMRDPSCDDAYSEWCQGNGELLGDDDAARAAGIID